MGRIKYSGGTAGSDRAGRGGMAGGRGTGRPRNGRVPEEPRDAWRVDLPLAASPRAAAWVMGVAAAALGALSLSEGLPPFVSAPAAAALLALGVRSIRREAYREGSGGAVRLVAALDGRVEVTEASGRTRGGRLVGPHFVAPWLAVVGWVPEGRRRPRALLVPPDSVPPAEFRRLRILLRWGGRQPAGPAPGAAAV